jgi:hypothetical protein
MSNEPAKPAARPERTAEELLRVVLEASRLAEAELSAYLWRERLHSTQLEEWRRAMLEYLSDAKSPVKRKSADRRRAKKEAEHICALERDLDRKNMVRKRPTDSWTAAATASPASASPPARTPAAFSRSSPIASSSVPTRRQFAPAQ